VYNPTRLDIEAIRVTAPPRRGVGGSERVDMVRMSKDSAVVPW
jgi:hypothetical protein